MAVPLNETEQKISMEQEVTYTLLTGAFHPIGYARTLMHLGYEPVKAIPGRTITGEPVMWLPNYFSYIGHIHSIDGFYGLYRGLAPKLVGSFLSLMWKEDLADFLGFSAFETEIRHNKMTEEEMHYIKFKQTLKRSIVVTATGIVVSQPFHVISLRMMAQFIGRETMYKTIMGSIKEIYQNEGLWGFYSGLVPKLCYELGRMVLTSVGIYLTNKYIVKNRLMRQFNNMILDFAFQIFLYPLTVVSTCMAVRGANMLAGRPPVMTYYTNWRDCYRILKENNDLKRGGSLFNRCYYGRPKPTLKCENGYVFLLSPQKQWW